MLIQTYTGSAKCGLLPTNQNFREPAPNRCQGRNEGKKNDSAQLLVRKGDSNNILVTRIYIYILPCSSQ